MSPTTGGYEEQPTIRGRLATRLDEVPSAASMPDIYLLTTCSGCGTQVIEPPPPTGALAGMRLPAICRPCVKAALARGDIVMAAQPFADKAPT